MGCQSLRAELTSAPWRARSATERLQSQQTGERTGSRPSAAEGGGAQRQPWARPITGLLLLPERDRQDDCVGLECIPQRFGDDRGSNRPSLRCQRLGGPTTRNGHVDVFTGEGVGEGLTYLSESYNCVAHNVSPIRVDY